MSEDFKPGEIVDITIKGARVDEWRPAVMELTVDSSADANSDLTTFDLASDQVTVERGAPAWWPPRPGDLFYDGSGVTRFAFACGSNVVLMSPYGEQIQPEESWEQRHGLKLVHREEDAS